ncbi:hypothetical protein FF38_01493, partial [Lucilia cuprina]
SFAAVLGIITLFYAEFIQVELFFNKSVLFYLTALGVLIAIGRASLASPDQQAQYDPAKAMQNIIDYTNYMPSNWKEVLGVLLNPIVLGVNMVENSDAIIDYFRVFSVKQPNYGGFVCKLACFDNNIEQVEQLSSELGDVNHKMVQSFINFKQTYTPHESNINTGNITSRIDDLNNEIDDMNASYRPDIHSDSDSDTEDLARDGVLGLCVHAHKRFFQHPLHH